MGPKGGWGGMGLSQTSPIPRSPCGGKMPKFDTLDALDDKMTSMLKTL